MPLAEENRPFSGAKIKAADNLPQTGNRTRPGYAGLKFGKAGAVDYGRHQGLEYGALSETDMLPLIGGASGYTDAFLSGRSTGVLTWRNSDLFGLAEGLNLAAQDPDKNDRSSNMGGVRRSNGDGFALSASYDFDSGLSFAGAFAGHPTPAYRCTR